MSINISKKILKKGIAANTIALMIILLLIAGSIYYIEKSKAGFSSFDIGSAQEDMPKDGKYPEAPELKGIAGYFNTEEGLKISDLKGKVVIIDFWTYSRINCIRTLPHLIEWDRKYRDMGLVIIGVHTPEFEFEKRYDNVKAAIERYGIMYPVVQDNDYATWQAYRNRFWPHKFIIDAGGFIRYDHIGEGAYKETEGIIQDLLAEAGRSVRDMALSEVKDKTPKMLTSPELYAGYGFALPRGRDIGNAGGLRAGETFDYVLPDKIKSDYIYLEGEWQSNEDNLESIGTSSIVLRFLAKSVNIVGENVSGPVKAEVMVNDKYVTDKMAGADVQFEDGKAFITVEEPRLYNVVDGMYGLFTLKLTADPGFKFNAFTFG